MYQRLLDESIPMHHFEVKLPEFYADGYKYYH